MLMLETKPILESRDALLIKALAKVFPPDDMLRGHFDAWLISTAIHKDSDLLAALEFLGVRRRVRGWTRGNLTSASEGRIMQWLHRVKGRDIGGLIVVLDARGWYHISPTGRVPNAAE